MVKVMILDNGLSARALAAALTSAAAGVEIVTADMSEQHQPTVTPFALPAEPRLLAGQSSHGPIRRGKRGKPLRW